MLGIFRTGRLGGGRGEDRVQENATAVGFYWTLPVPWAGFTDLPSDVDEAAALSMTIHYQRNLIRRYAKDHRMDLIHEEAFLEIEPDRGTQHVRDGLRKVETLCRTHDSTLLIVDFSEVQGWRSHAPLHEWAQSSRIDVRLIYPDPVVIDGKSFDPHSHFSEWRQRQHMWTEGKSDRAAACRAEAARQRAEGASYAAIAATLNARGLSNVTGKPWTADNLRKSLAKAST